MVSKLFRSKFIISSLLFLLALIPRLPDLGRFLTADEFLWVDRSRNFLAGLTDPAYQCTTVVAKWEYAQGLACTLRTGHPGVHFIEDNMKRADYIFQHLSAGDLVLTLGAGDIWKTGEELLARLQNGAAG